MLFDLEVILVETRFPENIGMAARACANMGCSHLTLVKPAWWDKEKASPLATAKGIPILDAVQVYASLQEALAPCVWSVGTTARTGGWRRGILSPEQASEDILPFLEEGRVALVFGPEDKGLCNQDIALCQALVTIPTAEASSLNLAQSVLLILYECLKTWRAATHAPRAHPDPSPQSRLITLEEQELVMSTVQDTLLRIDFLKSDNPDYFFMPLRRFMGKSGLRRHEMNMLMGICRQINNLTQKA